MTVADVDAGAAAGEQPALFNRVRAIVDDRVTADAARVDVEGIYPEPVLRALGDAGAYRQHLAGLSASGVVDIAAAVDSVAIVAESCLTTAFCMWCQNACAWYLENTTNTSLRNDVREAIGAGRMLGGTGLSNPMKAASGIEKLRLKAERVSDGFVLNGQIPFISNMGPGHPFGIVFEVGDHCVMALPACDMDGVSGTQNIHFCALEGTRTWSISFRDTFISDGRVIADPADDFLPLIRPGFMLLQVGLGLGVMRSAAREMRGLERRLGHVNAVLDEQPDAIDADVDEFARQMRILAATPTETDREFGDAVRRLRLAVGEGAIRAAHGALLHAGARGYYRDSPAQRRLREAYFVAIVTPAIKHLRHDLVNR